MTFQIFYHNFKMVIKFSQNCIKLVKYLNSCNISNEMIYIHLKTQLIQYSKMQLYFLASWLIMHPLLKYYTFWECKKVSFLIIIFFYPEVFIHCLLKKDIDFLLKMFSARDVQINHQQIYSTQVILH